MTVDQLEYNLPFEFNDYITGDRKEYVFDYAVVSGPNDNPAGDGDAAVAAEGEEGAEAPEPVMELLRPMKPAQLLMDCRFRYLLIRDVEAMTLTEMDATPLRMFAG